MQKRWIWPFELQEKIGEGGMGVVYRARYVGNGRIVALKLLPAEIASDSTILARFERELEVLKTLKHPHIVHSFGGVCEDEQRFYAMELIEGGSLEDVIRKRGRLSWEQCVEYSLQICAALSFAHEHGVVHRDLKPANLLLTKQGVLKLTDFGLAHVGAATKITAAGKTMGTFLYMAPEQIRGRPAPSPQTDLYALGCVMFEMLTGGVPFNGENAATILNEHLKTIPPRVSEFALNCPAALDELVFQLLHKSPEQRPPSAADVAERLRSLVPSNSLAATSPGRVLAEEPQSTVAAIPVDVSSRLVSRVVTPIPPELKPRSASARGHNRLLVLMGVMLALLGLGNVYLWDQYRVTVRAQALWMEAYGSPHVAVRAEAARALGEIGARSGVVAALIEGLSDDSAEVREATMLALIRLNADAKPAIGALMSLQKNDENPRIRNQAASALEVIQRAEPARSRWFYISLLALIPLAVVGWIKLKKTAEENKRPPLQI
jgi:eukaryotic-like serine/threonine-protein kinase